MANFAAGCPAVAIPNFPAGAHPVGTLHIFIAQGLQLNMTTFQPDHSNLMVMALLSHLPAYLSTPQMLEGETTPPPLLHEADLIALMDKHGIGEVCMYSVVHHVDMIL